MLSVRNFSPVEYLLVDALLSPNSASALGIASTEGVKLDWTPFTFVVVLYSPNVAPSPS